MGKIYGYVRVSTMKQDINRQIRDIKAIYPNAIIVSEKYTGRKLDRPEWPKLYKTVKAGDVIVFDEVSRMSRDAVDGFEVYQELFNRGVTLVFLKEPLINTTVYQEAIDKQIETVKTGDAATDELTEAIMAALNRYMMRLAERQIKLAFEQAQKEADFISERTKGGIETARLSGKQIGNINGVKLTTKKSIAAKAKIMELSKDFAGTLDDADVIKVTGISRNTFYKYKRELREGV